MDLKTAIGYVKQYRYHGKSCYIHAANRQDATFYTNEGQINFVCYKCHYRHGGKSKWWRAYLQFAETGKAVPSRLFAKLEEV